MHLNIKERVNYKEERGKEDKIKWKFNLRPFLSFHMSLLQKSHKSRQSKVFMTLGLEVFPRWTKYKNKEE